MEGLVHIDRVQELLEDIAETLPEPFFHRLSGGVVLSEEEKIHPESRGEELLILGEYQRSPFGATIVIYYGSFMKMYGHLPEWALKEKLEETLLHEFTHHLEFLGGERGLEIKDARQMKEYREGGGHE